MESSDQACNSAEEVMEEESEDEDFLPDYQTLQDYSKALLGEVVKATKAANALPQEGDDYDYYSSFPGFRTFHSKMGSRVTRSIGRLIRHESLPCYWPPVSLAPPSSEEAGLVTTTPEELEERMEAIVEANDILLERVGVLMDEACGLRKKEEEVIAPVQLQQGTAEVASWNKKDSSGGRGVASFNFMASRNVPRPQVRFRDQVDNSNTAFVPRLRCKPNAREPLPEVYHRLQEPQSLNSLIANSKEWALFKQTYTHPYRYELENFVPTDEQIQLREPQMPGSLDEVSYSFISREEELEQLVAELSQCSEFAIDLENHSYRSFQGFVCLMQITTRSHDYIIDTLELRHHMHILLHPFTDPRIVKVMHGADWDIPWLQRDFGLYVVNLFDTGQASRVLKLPKFSLAFLLQYCCGVTADKQYQLADWRIRPLPAQMERYAREDTHYLLYIYDRMRNELIRRNSAGQNLLQLTLDLSRDVCLKTYHKQIFNEDAYLKLYYKHKRNFNSQQLRCLQLLYEWRDRVAREEDESQGYVLPNHMLFKISEQLPREAQGVLACCTPIPTLLRQQLQEVFMLVHESRQTPLSNELPKMRAKAGPVVPASVPSVTLRGCAPHTHTPPSTPTLHREPLTVAGSQPRHIETRGPPVKTAPPSLPAMEWGCPEVSGAARQQLLQIQASFPDVLAQFMEIRSAAESTAIGQTTPGEEASPRIKKASTEAISPEPSPTISVSKPPGVTGRGRAAPKKLQSVREMGRGKAKQQRVSSPEGGGDTREEGEICEEEEEEEEGGEVKKMKLDGERDGFTPFQYQGVSFTDYTKEPGHPPAVHMFQPPSRRSKDSSSSPRSRVHQRSSEHSHTYSTSSRGHSSSKQRLWPRKV